MTPKLFEPRNCSEAAIGESGKLGYRQESEIAGSLAGIQQQAEVRGRDAGSFKKAGLLDVVRDEVVVDLGTKLVKVAPDSQCVRQQECLVARSRGAYVCSRSGALSHAVTNGARAHSNRMGAATTSA